VDPVTHAALGAAAGYCAAEWLDPERKLGGVAMAVGALAALLPDLDVVIRSSTDPLLVIEHHRGFTHSLAFAPLGAGVATLPWLLVPRLRVAWRAVLAAALVGYASHGLLDGATTYGTQLFWPVSSYRVGLDIVSIIDPVFSFLLILGLVVALFRRSSRPAALGLAAGVLYLGMGFVQRERAISAQERIAADRGHERLRGAVFPSFANNVVWRSLYQAGDSLYVDRVRVPWLAASAWSGGPELALFREAELGERAAVRPRVVRDFRRFAWFADGWVARAPGDPDVIGDVRYSVRTDEFEPVWGIRFVGGAEPTTEWLNRSRQRELGLRPLWLEISGRDPSYRPIR
jgi:inner membrane protein